MARDLNPYDATIKAIRQGDTRKRLSDGDGLFLLLFANAGSYGWRLDCTYPGRRNLISLSTYPDTSLALARRKAEAARALVAERHHDRPMSDNTINAALRAMGFSQDEVTGHGFRATARTMLHERLGFSPDIIEAQLAHSVRDNLGRACNRTEFTEQRRAMLQSWADYLDQLRIAGDAVPGRAAAAEPARAPAPAPSPLPALPAQSAPCIKAADMSALARSMRKDDFSTIEAAKFSNASHLFIAQEIDAGRLKCRQVGVDLRTSVGCLVAYAVETRLGG